MVDYSTREYQLLFFKESDSTKKCTYRITQVEKLKDLNRGLERFENKNNLGCPVSIIVFFLDL